MQPEKRDGTALPLQAPLPERHTVELAAGSVVIERYHWENAATGKRGIQWLSQVVNRDGNLTLYKVCRTRSEALEEALDRG